MFVWVRNFTHKVFAPNIRETMRAKMSETPIFTVGVGSVVKKTVGIAEKGVEHYENHTTKAVFQASTRPDKAEKRQNQKE